MQAAIKSRRVPRTGHCPRRAGAASPASPQTSDADGSPGTRSDRVEGSLTALALVDGETEDCSKASSWESATNKGNVEARSSIKRANPIE